MQIVLARVEEDQIVVQQGRIDLGERHKLKTVARPVSLMWANDGTATDTAKARAFADREGYTVFHYDGEEFPLERARNDILADIKMPMSDADLGSQPSPKCPVCRGFGGKLWIGHKDDHTAAPVACSECWRYQG